MCGDARGAMTDMLTRPSRTTTGAPPARQPLEAGITAAAWSVGAGLIAIAVPVLLVWAADARTGAGAGEAMRTAGQTWLVAHGVALRVPAGSLGLAPLGLLLLPLALLVRAGGHIARACRGVRLRDPLVLSGAVAAPYAVLAAVVAAVSSTPSVRPVSWQALLGGLLVGGLGSLLGAMRAADLWPTVPPLLGARVMRLLTGMAAALA